MAQNKYLFCAFIIFLSLFFVLTKSSIPCKTRTQCPEKMCRLPKFVWCIDGSCVCA
ncbi:Nodule Cysteine-Rich (NCR) secreted peptide [Medicago truncatula]|uniref:Nodule Cysteine-Rich (NCR) secreted peptide n=2 Tax=Medicago truncatula TaxID=3880 RepID=A0A072V920_MEDTR|nr:Nodule Cysteine-Rich (NCR) secreted peptide [Medicago truncatula]